MIGCPWLLQPWVGAGFFGIAGLFPIVLSEPPVRYSPLWPASRVGVTDKTRNSRSADVRRVC